MTPLIDQFLPDYQFRECHVCRVRAHPGAVLEAVRVCDLGRSPLVRALFRLRGMPTGLMTITDMETMGFRLLGHEAERELVLGLIGRFWTFSGGIQTFEPEAFRSFDRPAVAKATISFRVRAEPSAVSRLTTETRVWCPNNAIRRRFYFYWSAIRPFSGMVRREWLRLIKRHAERAAPTRGRNARKGGQRSLHRQDKMGSGVTRWTATLRRRRQGIACLLARVLTPAVYRWILKQEDAIRRYGRPLAPAEMKSARRLKISDPGRIRVRVVERIPQPAGWPLKMVARFSRVALANPVALTAGHGIYLCHGVENNPVVLRHELAHVGQYERMGRRAFLQQYIHDCLLEGYVASPLEKEARRLSVFAADEETGTVLNPSPEAVIRPERRP